MANTRPSPSEHRYPFIAYQPYLPPGSAPEEARRQYQVMAQRRSVRFFSPRPVEREVIEWAVRTAGTAPSGANKQPWRFVCVSDPALKSKIRQAAETEEREFYGRRAGPEWIQDLAPLETTADKEFLEVAPWLIAVFKLAHSDDGGQVYYANESVGIAVGMLLGALQHAGLAALTHTPSPMKFLAQVLERPAHERAYLLLPVGYPAEGCVVPDIHRKSLEEIAVFRERT
jgi:iodotyrosine deiodinase